MEDQKNSEQILLYILENDNISLNTKIKLIIIKIKNYSNKEELKKYINKVSEISKLTNVFDNEDLIIGEMNDGEKEILSNLMDYGYIKNS